MYVIQDQIGIFVCLKSNPFSNITPERSSKAVHIRPKK